MRLLTVSVLGLALACSPVAFADPCAAPAVPFDTAAIVVKGFTTVAADDTFRLVGTMVPAAPFDPAIYGFGLVLDNQFSTTIMDAAVPGGSGWRPGARGGWQYRDRTGAFGGITRATFRPLAGGAIAIRIDGRRHDYARSEEIPPLRALIALGTSGEGWATCGETFFSQAGCTFTAFRNTLRCTPPPRQRRCPVDSAGRVRCDALNVAAAQDAYFAVHGTYYSGKCRDLPGFVPSPHVVCVVNGVGNLWYVITTASPLSGVVCTYTSAPQPGEANLVCS